MYWIAVAFLIWISPTLLEESRIRLRTRLKTKKYLKYDHFKKK